MPCVAYLRRFLFWTLALASAQAANPALADAVQRLQHARGFVLTAPAGLLVQVTPDGFVVADPQNVHRREALSIVISVVPPPLPHGLRGCRLLRPSLRCSWTRQEAGGSSGEPVTITIYAPLGDEYARYHQEKFKDGFWPSFEALEWLESGQMAVTRGQ